MSDSSPETSPPTTARKAYDYPVIRWDPDTIVPPLTLSPNTSPKIHDYPVFLSNAIYLTYHVPCLDDCPRSIWVTHPYFMGGAIFSGELSPASSTTFPAVWTTHRKSAHRVHSFLTLLRIGHFGGGPVSDKDFSRLDGLRGEQFDQARLWAKRCEDVLMTVTVEADMKGHRGGHTWCVEAVRALVDGGLADIGKETPEEILMRARLLAGPEELKPFLERGDCGMVKVLN